SDPGQVPCKVFIRSQRSGAREGGGAAVVDGGEGAGVCAGAVSTCPKAKAALNKRLGNMGSSGGSPSIYRLESLSMSPDGIGHWTHHSRLLLLQSELAAFSNYRHFEKSRYTVSLQIPKPEQIDGFPEMNRLPSSCTLQWQSGTLHILERSRKEMSFLKLFR